MIYWKIDLQKAQSPPKPMNELPDSSRKLAPHGSKANSSVHASLTQLHEVAHMGELFRARADVRFFARQRGECTSTLRSVAVGAITLNEFQCTGPLMVEGAAKRGFTTLLIPEPREHPVTFCGQSVGSHQLMIYGQTAEHMTAQENRTGFHVFMPIGILEAALSVRLNADPIDFSGQRRLVTPGLKPMNRLRTLVREFYQRVAIDSDLKFSPLATWNLQSSLIDEISGILAMDQSIMHDIEIGAATASRILQIARDWFEQAGRKPTYLYELCDAIGVSERLLQLVFKQQFGISPMKYLKLRRLHLLRERLITTSANDVSIKKAALETGLWRLNRFAQDYRNLFGELPSETARA